MQELNIDIDRQTTRVVIRAAALDTVGALLDSVATPDAPISRVLLVTDDTVGPLYAEPVLAALQSAGISALEHRIPAGESSKTLARLAEVFDSLARGEFDRSGLVLALGGGVVSDLAGFAAATWMRGIRFAICPTTLEADIDAAIGGKTAVNLPAGKNLVGAFHQPVLVVVDPNCLTTLPPRDIRAGLAESVKHALIASEPFFDWHEANADHILALQPDAMSKLIHRNLKIKADIVSQDAHERSGQRLWLNLGHSIGHAIESRCAFTLRHGECVALGLVAACRLSESLGLLDHSVVTRTVQLLERLGLSTRLEEPIAADDILAAMRHDKKVLHGKLQLVLLEGFGQPVIRTDVAEDDVRQAYESLTA